MMGRSFLVFQSFVFPVYAKTKELIGKIPGVFCVTFIDRCLLFFASFVMLWQVAVFDHETGTKNICS